MTGAFFRSLPERPRYGWRVVCARRLLSPITSLLGSASNGVSHNSDSSVEPVATLDDTSIHTT
jgi:hypothetical protein